MDQGGVPEADIAYAVSHGVDTLREPTLRDTARCRTETRVERLGS